MEIQPMDFYLRQLEPMLFDARQVLADFVGTAPNNLAFVDNATYAMNVVASSVDLKPGDEVVLTDQCYGAVRRIWQKACLASGAKIVEAELPSNIESKQQVVERILAATSAKTKIAIISHIVSVSGLIMPVDRLCACLAEKGILTCLDGPHAPLQVDLNLDQLGCDFYTASCHKWLCGPLGTGFVFVAAKHHDRVVEPILGWGRLLPRQAESWDQEQIWLGTRNVSGILAIPTAIEYFENLGFENVRARVNYLATTAQEMLLNELGTETIASRSDGWYGSMAHVALPDGDWSDLQSQLWTQAKIESPVWELNGRWWIRVSCHLYNDMNDLEKLANQLKKRIDKNYSGVNQIN